MGWAGHHPLGRAQGAWRALLGGGPMLAPLQYFFLPIILIYSKNILREVSGLLELCRIGILMVLFQVQISSCRNSPSLCIPCKL